MNFPPRVLIVLPSLLAFFQSSTFAAITLSGLFSDHAILQRGDHIPVWGTAAPGEKVTVQVGTASGDAVADADGSWKAFLNLQKEQEGPLELTATGGDSKVVATDILIGEVWVCSGQSNMRFHLSQTTGGDVEAAQANDPKFRYFSVGLKPSETPVKTLREKWVLCDPTTAPSFSGVGYYMGKTLRHAINAPVGLIDISWAGVCIETWMSPEALASNPDFKPIVDRWAQKVADYPAKKADWDAKKDALLAAWQQDADQAKTEGKPEPMKPGPPSGSPASLDEPSCLYHGETMPVAPYGIRGVLWYQGEQNVGRAFQYRKLLAAMIPDWRKLWDLPDLPFVVIQLPNYGKSEPQPRSNNFAELRESQALATSLPHVELVVTIDAGEEGNIHPKNKQIVGERAGRLIAKDIDGAVIAEDVHGPTFKDIAVEGDSIRVHFDHAAGLKTRDGQPPTDFAISGAENRYVWAKAKIDGESVVVTAPGLANPVSVRYDWAASPQGNLCNRDNLPAAPFRTDTFPVSTEQQK